MSQRECYQYRVNEFIIDSDFPLVADRNVVAPSGGFPLRLRRESLAEIPSLLRKIRRQLAYDVGTGLLLEPRLTLALLIDYRSDSIVVDCTDESLIAASAWLWNAALGCRTILRSGLPLHAAGVQISGKYIGIAATSGSGKSTLTHYLLSSGLARFGNDDLIPIYTQGDTPMAFPSVALYPKIGADIVERNNLSIASLIRSDSDPNREEYYVPLRPEQRVVEPAPLSALFLLAPNDHTDKVLCETVVDATAFFFSELHGNWLVGRFLDNRKIRRQVEALLDIVPVYRLVYRRSFDILPRIAEIITQTLQKEVA